MKIRRQPLTQERLKLVGYSYRYMFLLSQLLELEYSQHLDTDFRNPNIHNKISKMSGLIGEVSKHTSLVLGDSDQETILEYVDDLNEIVKTLLNLEPEEIKRFSENLETILNR